MPHFLFWGNIRLLVPRQNRNESSRKRGSLAYSLAAYSRTADTGHIPETIDSIAAYFYTVL